MVRPGTEGKGGGVLTAVRRAMAAVAEEEDGDACIAGDEEAVRRGGIPTREASGGGGRRGRGRGSPATARPRRRRRRPSGAVAVAPAVGRQQVGMGRG